MAATQQNQDQIAPIMPVTNSSGNRYATQVAGNNGVPGQSPPWQVSLTQGPDTQSTPLLVNTPQITQTAHSNSVAAQAAQAAPADLVENRVGNIINSNSPLMQLAEARANQRANDRGLLSSSLAVGSAQNAVMDAATPIATADSNAINQNNQFNASAQQQTNLQNAAQAQRTSELNAASDNSAINTNTENAMRTNLANLDVASRAFLQGMDTRSKQLIQSSANASALFSKFNDQVAAIQTSPNLDAAGKQRAIANLQTMLQSSLAAQDAIAGLDLASLVNDPNPYTVTANSSNDPNTPPTGSPGDGNIWYWNGGGWEAKPRYAQNPNQPSNPGGGYGLPQSDGNLHL